MSHHLELMFLRKRQHYRLRMLPALQEQYPGSRRILDLPRAGHDNPGDVFECVLDLTKFPAVARELHTHAVEVPCIAASHACTFASAGSPECGGLLDTEY